MTSVSLLDRVRLAAVHNEARSAPVFYERHKEPCVVIVAVEAYATLRLRRDDPLVYDTSDPHWMSQMIDALSGFQHSVTGAHTSKRRTSSVVTRSASVAGARRSHLFRRPRRDRERSGSICSGGPRALQLDVAWLRRPLQPATSRSGSVADNASASTQRAGDG